MSRNDKKIAVNRWNFIKTGVLLIALGICFLYDRTFFFYPPSLAPAWNNVWVDAIGLSCGVVLLLIGLTLRYSDWLVKTTLSVSVAFFTVLLIADLFHVIGAGYYRFHPDIILEIYTVINLMQLAYEYVPKEKSKN